MWQFFNAGGPRPAHEAGYEPQLKRTLGTFQVFAISFAFISVPFGVFDTHNDVLQNGG